MAIAQSEVVDVDILARAAQPRQLIVTLYGLYARDEGGWLSVASIVSLLGDLGVDEPSARSSISRLKRRGVLKAERRGVAGYSLSDDGMAMLHEGDHRIFRQQRARLTDGWLLAVFSVPEEERSKRHLLRSLLTRLGFGTAAPGVWIAPMHLHGATAKALHDLGLSGYADLFRGDHLASGDLPAKIRSWWDLAGLETLYSSFLVEHTPAAERWCDGQVPTTARRSSATCDCSPTGDACPTSTLACPRNSSRLPGRELGRLSSSSLLKTLGKAGQKIRGEAEYLWTGCIPLTG